MELRNANVNSMLIVTDALVGAAGREILGGPSDGAPAPRMVIAQLEVTSLAPERRGQARISHLGLTRAGALDLARQLTNAANMLPEE